MTQTEIKALLEKQQKIAINILKKAQKHSFLEVFKIVLTKHKMAQKDM